MKNRYKHPGAWTRLEQFEVGDLVRYDRHLESPYADVAPYVVLIERRAAGMVWKALFPSGDVWTVPWEQLSRID